MKTRKKTLKSPQNSRLFSALFSGAFLSFRWSLLFLFFWINVTAYLGITSSPWWKQRLSILSYPTSSLEHTQLAQMYWQVGQKTEAQHELAIAADIQVNAPESNVLGETIASSDLLKEWQREPEALRKSYTYWKAVIAERPDYRDAYIQLAYLAYLLRLDTETDKYINQILHVDPTYPKNLISHTVSK